LEDDIDDTDIARGNQQFSEMKKDSTINEVKFVEEDKEEIEVLEYLLQFY